MPPAHPLVPPEARTGGARPASPVQTYGCAGACYRVGHPMETAPPTLEASATLASVRTRDASAGRVRLTGGDRAGRYTVDEVIGAGAMGVVYRAHDPELDRVVALKLVDRLPGRQETDRETFLAEARALAKLSSANVVAVFDVGTVGDAIFIAMEYVPGITLDEWLARGRDRAQILAMFVQAGRGLADAHAAGIVHGDFKPSNVMVDETGRARVLDFGLARPAQGEPHAPDGEADGVFRPRGGTPAYMAPELFAGESGDARADQFGFCVALWEALVGERPFPGDTVPAIVTSIALGRIRPIPASTRIPRWLQSAMRRGLRAASDDRWPSMDALLRELSRPRRALRHALLGATLLGATAAAFALGTQRDPVAECTRALDNRTAFWDPARSESIRAAILETGMPYADRVAQRVDSDASAYVERWRTAWIDVCATAEAERPPALRAAAQACLEDRRRRFDALATLLLRISSDDLSRVSEAVAELPGVEVCTDDTKLSAAARGEAEDPEVREEVAALREELSRTWALQNLGNYEEAARVAAQAIERAEATEFTPLQFEANLVLGDRQLALERLEMAEVHLERAFQLAVELGDPEARLDAALSLAFHAVSAGKNESGRHWIFVAEALLARPEIDDGRRARFHILAAELDQADGRTDAAIIHDLRARDILRRTHGEHSVRYATHTLRMSHLLRRTGQTAQALGLQDAAIAVLRAEYGDNHPHVADAINARALTYLQLGRIEEATEQFEIALRVWRQTLPDDHPSVAFALVNLARTRSDMGDLAAALELCEEALGIRERSLGDHLHVAYTRTDLAELLRRVGRLAEAEKESSHALASIERELGAGHPNSAQALTVVGRVHLDAGRVDEAVTTLRRALAARESTEYEHIPGESASTQAALALALARTPGHQDEALALAVEARSGFSATEKRETSMLATDEAELRAWLDQHRKE